MTAPAAMPVATEADLAGLLTRLRAVTGLPGFAAERARVAALVVDGALETSSDAMTAAIVLLEQLAAGEVDDLGGNLLIKICSWVIHRARAEDDADAESCA